MFYEVSTSLIIMYGLDLLMHYPTWIIMSRGLEFWKEQFFNIYKISCHMAFAMHLVIIIINRGTTFAYGQTSRGKTFTMNGFESYHGIIHQAVNDVFRNIRMV